ncbi:hypothetical protein SDC9_86788 [bioreactor metagenome]|uniref:Uncharacterized protein n=1 Tax=bioreactor metagenome TaxID=1076179 RepID=A0A644ZH69_9ZZZZ
MFTGFFSVDPDDGVVVDGLKPKSHNFFHLVVCNLEFSVVPSCPPVPVIAFIHVECVGDNSWSLATLRQTFLAPTQPQSPGIRIDHEIPFPVERYIIPVLCNQWAREQSNGEIES